MLAQTVAKLKPGAKNTIIDAIFILSKERYVVKQTIPFIVEDQVERFWFD